MTKAELTEKVASLQEDTRLALQMVYDSLNSGQQKKILKNEAVKTLFDRYAVEYENG